MMALEGVFGGATPEMRRLAGSLNQLATTLRDVRMRSPGVRPMDTGLQSEPLPHTAYGKAIQCIRHGPHNAHRARAGEYDKEIHTLFASYLANKYPGASLRSIERNSKHRAVRAWSAFHAGIGNILGPLATTIATAAAPKLAPFGITLGEFASVSGTSVGAMIAPAVPIIFSALFIAVAFGAPFVARYATRGAREGRKAGNILKDTMHDSVKLNKLRAAVASGSDIFKEFEDILEERERGAGGFLRKHSNKLWSLGMLSTGLLLGTVGAGLAAEMETIGKLIKSRMLPGTPGHISGIVELIELFRNNPNALQEEFWKRMPHVMGTGIEEVKNFIKLFWASLFG